MDCRDDSHQAPQDDLQTAFSRKGIGHELPPGEYEFVTDEELIEGLSFPVYRHVSNWIMVPAKGSIAATETLAMDPDELAAAQDSDRTRETYNSRRTY